METIKEIYSDISKGVFWTTLITSIILMVASFIVPPTGEISPNVLQGTGELAFFAVLGTINHAIERGRKVTLNHGSTNVSIDED